MSGLDRAVRKPWTQNSGAVISLPGHLHTDSQSCQCSPDLRCDPYLRQVVSSCRPWDHPCPISGYFPLSPRQTADKECLCEKAGKLSRHCWRLIF